MKYGHDVCLPLDVLSTGCEDDVFPVEEQSLVPTPSSYVPRFPLV